MPNPPCVTYLIWHFFVSREIEENGPFCPVMNTTRFVDYRSLAHRVLAGTRAQLSPYSIAPECNVSGALVLREPSTNEIIGIIRTDREAKGVYRWAWNCLTRPIFYSILRSLSFFPYPSSPSVSQLDGRKQLTTFSARPFALSIQPRPLFPLLLVCPPGKTRGRLRSTRGFARSSHSTPTAIPNEIVINWAHDQNASLEIHWLVVDNTRYRKESSEWQRRLFSYWFNYFLFGLPNHILS